MLDDLDAMLEAERQRLRQARRTRTPRPVTRTEITYWSQAENRYKTRWTTCVFRPTGEP